MMRKNNNRNNNMKHRSGGGGGGGGQGGRRYQNNGGGGGNRHNDGQNITRQKHHATQMREKFSNMARDAQNNGDRVDVEYYLQHVDHYTRVLTEIAGIEAERFSHQREQQVQHTPENSGTENNGETSSDTHASSENNATSEGDNGAPQQNNNQPRMTRQRHPRQHHSAPAAEATAATAATDPNHNGNDIPLPGSVLPQI